MNIKKTVGTRINAALVRCNVLQKDLAKELGVTDNTISYFCNGTRGPQLEQLPIIAKFLNTTADYLLGISDDPNISKSAVDDLGISAIAVEKILEIKKKPNGAVLVDTLSKLIENELFEAFLQDIFRYKDAVDTELEFLRGLEHDTNTLGYFDEGILAEKLTKSLQEEFPNIPKSFVVIAGYERVQQLLDHVKSDIDTILACNSKNFELNQLYMGR